MVTELERTSARSACGVKKLGSGVQPLICSADAAGAEDPGAVARGPRRAALDRPCLWTSRLRSRLWWQRRRAVGSVASVRSMRWWRRNGDRVGGRTRGGAERLGIGSGCEGGRDLGSSVRRTLSSASTSEASRSWAGRLGSAATPSRPSASVERRSPATRLCAWARRNSDQLGPIRRGAGPRPALRNTLAIVVAETLTPSPFSSPWMRM